MKFSIVTLYVQDIQKEKAFYGEILGLPLSQQFSQAPFVMFEPESGPALALEDVSILPDGHAKQPGIFEIGFEVEDVDATYQQWKRQGVEMVTEPETQPFGRTFLAKDPEGHYICVFRLARS